ARFIDRSDSTAGHAAAVLLCACGRRKRARVLRSRAASRTRSAFLRFAVAGAERFARAARAHRRYGRALLKRDSRTPSQRAIFHRWPIARRHHRLRDGATVERAAARGGAARLTRFISGGLSQTKFR